MTDLRTYQYRIRLVHELKDTGAAQRLNFANAIFVSSFRNISFSGKAHFYIDGLETDKTAAVGVAKNTKHHNSKIRYVSTWHKPIFLNKKRLRDCIFTSERSRLKSCRVAEHSRIRYEDPFQQNEANNSHLEHVN